MIPRLRFGLLLVVASGVLGGGAPGVATSASSAPFRANVHETLVCPGVDLCGTGVIQGYGAVTTTLSFATLERVFTHDSDGSTLRLALVPTGATGMRLDGVWTIVSGTGVFAGASGAGELWATGTGAPELSDTAHYRGVLTLPG